MDHSLNKPIQTLPHGKVVKNNLSHKILGNSHYEMLRYTVYRTHSFLVASWCLHHMQFNKILKLVTSSFFTVRCVSGKQWQRNKQKTLWDMARVTDWPQRGELVANKHCLTSCEGAHITWGWLMIQYNFVYYFEAIQLLSASSVTSAFPQLRASPVLRMNISCSLSLFLLCTGYFLVTSSMIAWCD